MEHRIQADTRMSSSARGVWFVAMGAALWGIGPLFRVWVMESMTSTQIVLIEHLMLALYAIPVLWMHRKELRNCTWKHVLALLFLSWGGSVVATIMFTEAFAHGDANGVLLLQKLQPVFAIILARLLLKETLPRRFSLLLILAIIGTYLLTFGWSLPIGHYNEVIGFSSLLALGAAFLWGGSTVMGRLLLDRMEYETVTSLRFLMALPLLIVLTSWESPSWNFAASEWGTLSFYIFLQALLPGLVSLLLYYRGLSTTKASYATLAELSFPLVGMMMNWFVFHQAVTAAQISGFVLIWIALYMVSRQN
ncbi:MULTISPECIES: DMT family transporter [unclassified Paenibacillus]|uniref:DMT family transporter n=1 Tax=unclassified Paenibacillus TaxID=185978 RepID=UPI00048BF467|nr:MULTISPECIES: DMT family transporter [unclassified Paenibacillus]SDG05811.1 EamA domain-containing membrane protein RarD [Paenibacillus sp. cl6col]